MNVLSATRKQPVLGQAARGGRTVGNRPSMARTLPQALVNSGAVPIRNGVMTWIAAIGLAGLQQSAHEPLGEVCRGQLQRLFAGYLS